MIAVSQSVHARAARALTSGSGDSSRRLYAAARLPSRSSSGSSARNRSYASGKIRPSPLVSRATSAGEPVATPVSTSSDTTPGWVCAYRRPRAEPKDTPHTSQRPMPRWARSRSRSAMRCGAVLTLMSVAGSAADGRDRPAPRWSNRTMR